MQKTGPAALLAIGLSACALIVDSDAPGLQLSADRASYAAGEVVELTLANLSGRDFTVHPELCGAALQRWQAFTWRGVPTGSGTCTRAGYDLSPGRRLVTPKALPDTLSPGRYRYAYAVHEWQIDERFRREVRTELYREAIEVR